MIYAKPWLHGLLALLFETFPADRAGSRTHLWPWFPSVRRPLFNRPTCGPGNGYSRSMLQFRTDRQAWDSHRARIHHRTSLGRPPPSPSAIGAPIMARGRGRRRRLSIRIRSGPVSSMINNFELLGRHCRPGRVVAWGKCSISRVGSRERGHEREMAG